jgi:ATP-binding cassette subfamily B multidrug efflux pump
MSFPLLKLVPYLLRHRRRFAVGSVFLVLATGIQLIAPWVLKYAIDDLLVGGTRGRIGFYAGLLVGIALVGGVCRFCMRRIIIGASREIEYDLRNDFFAHLQQLSLGYFQSHRTGDLMSRATNDLNAVRMMVGPALMYSATTSIVFVVAVALMLSISLRLTLFVLLPLPLVSVAVKAFGSAIYRRSEQIQAQLAHISAVTQEALAGVRVVRAYGREEVEIERFRGANLEYLHRSRTVIQLQALFYPSMALLLGLSALIVLWLGSREVIQERMTVGDFVAFNAYLARLSWPMIAFGWVTNMLQRGLAAWRRMLEVLEAEPAISDPGPHPTLASPADIRGRIEFRDLSFAYNGQQVLDNVSATVEPGQMMAIVGPTGGGKSTLVDLLPRLFDPPAGTVLVDGVDVREIPLAVLRGAIGYVPQETFLFSTTIAENVAFGAIEDGSDWSAAAAVARLDADIDDFPEGFQTAVGERGITLSGGQKQRTALARALLMDPRILVLDDALSAVDTHTEEEILSRLRGVMRQRTSIVVSHRISTIRDADLILVLDHGRVVERGTHDELIACDGFYANLYRKQLLEAELEES